MYVCSKLAPTKVELNIETYLIWAPVKSELEKSELSKYAFSDWHQSL